MDEFLDKFMKNTCKIFWSKKFFKRFSKKFPGDFWGQFSEKYIEEILEEFSRDFSKLHLKDLQMIYKIIFGVNPGQIF